MTPGDGGCGSEEYQGNPYRPEKLIYVTNRGEKELIDMASTKEYLDFVLEQLSGLDEISNRAMMGEYILYYRGRVFGVCTLF
ncbi:MAG: hypothetical protein K6F44_00150 [Lachnospiraceae bacterium]|nr:hypothetical protein [Lachnospiraceae bacterium]